MIYIEKVSAYESISKNKPIHTDLCIDSMARCDWSMQFPIGRKSTSLIVNVEQITNAAMAFCAFRFYGFYIHIVLTIKSGVFFSL